MARSPVTVLFADIADSTSLYTALGDLPGRETVAQALQWLVTVIEAADGRVIKTLGDEIMAVFDSGQRAAQAAMAMQERVSEERTATQPPLAIRVGMHTGMALLEEGDVYGDVVNTAARITALAKPEQILATEATIESLDESWRERLHALGPHTIRGKRGAIDLFEIVWSRADMTMIVAPQSVRGGGRRGPTLRLRLGNVKREVSGQQPRCTAGRSSRNDLVVADHFASRLHVEIEYRFGQFVLTDRSTNGTYVKPRGSAEIFIRRDRLTLRDGGEIGLGRPAQSEPKLAIQYSLDR